MVATKRDVASDLRVDARSDPLRFPYYWQRPSDHAAAGGNALLVLVLFNLNIVVLSVLRFSLAEM